MIFKSFSLTTEKSLSGFLQAVKPPLVRPKAVPRPSCKLLLKNAPPIGKALEKVVIIPSGLRWAMISLIKS